MLENFTGGDYVACSPTPHKRMKNFKSLKKNKNQADPSLI